MDLKILALTYLTIFVPVLGSLTIPLAGLFSPRARSIWSVFIAFLTAVLPYFLIPFALSGQEIVFRRPFMFGFDFIVLVDAFSVFVSIISSSIGALIVLYSLDYVKDNEFQSEYYLMVILFVGSMMGLVYSGNLIFIYLFWEIAAICSWRLIGFYRYPAHVIKADKAFLVTFFGAVVMLLGFLQIASRSGTFDITAMRNFPISGLATFLILVGMFSKSATFPLHTWLPDAGVAPSTVTSLLHAAVLVKIGVYAYGRIFCYGLHIPDAWASAIPLLAMLSSLIAAGAAFIETDIKRILALSTVSQIGYIFLGFSSMSPAGVGGATLFILMHGISKAGLFLCAGIIEHGTHKRDIRELGGLYRTMPFTAVSFFFCALSTIGIPPFGGFFSKFLVILGTAEAGFTTVAALALFIAVMTIFYLFRLFHAIFLGEEKSAGHEGSPVMVGVVVLLAAASLLSGLFVKYPMNVVNAAVAGILGVAK